MLMTPTHVHFRGLLPTTASHINLVRMYFPHTPVALHVHEAESPRDEAARRVMQIGARITVHATSTDGVTRIWQWDPETWHYTFLKKIQNS
jgi:hypothetical protein